MVRQIQRGIGAIAITALYGWAGAAVAAEPTAAQRLEMLERTDLPKAQTALKRHLQHCDTQLAVLHARRAMAMAEDGNDTGIWLDMEVLTTQCQVTAQQLRTQIEALEAEQLQLKNNQSKQPLPQ